LLQLILVGLGDGWQR